MSIHAHIESASTDCDGSYTSGHMMVLSDAERAHCDEADGVNDFHEIQFTDRVVTYVVNAYSLDHDGTLLVRRLGDGDVRITWNEATDEGHRQVEATICRDDCEDSEPWQRDHRAEAMGY